MNFFQHVAATSVMLPTSIEIKISEDGDEYKTVFEEQIETIEDRYPIIKQIRSSFDGQKVGWIKIVAENRADLPEWHIRKGDAWIFVDEVSIK